MELSKIAMLAGAGLFFLGAAFYLVPDLKSAFSWFGKLPGDFNYQGENTRVFIPITSMVLLSLVLSLVMQLFRR